MHDVHRDSLICKKGGRKRQKDNTRHEQSRKDSVRHDDLPHDDHMHAYDATQEQDHEHVHAHGKDLTHGHKHRHYETGIDGHVHGDDNSHDHGEDHAHEDHDHEDTHDTGHRGHDHAHDDSAYEKHGHDIHAHGHEQDEFEDHAYAHMHDHAHSFYHGHHHKHDPEHTTVMHKIFKDPGRDFFGAALMTVLILAGYLKWVPSPLAEGMLLCAAIIGIFPLIKNAFFDCLKNRKVNIELFVGLALITGLCLGKFLEVSLICLFILLGSFFRLNFSWRNA
jgi:cation transport ATPase